MDWTQFEARIKEHLSVPDSLDFGKHVTDMFSHGGVVMDLSCQIYLMKQALMEASIREDLLSEESRLRAIGQRGQIAGIQNVLQLIHKIIADELEARRPKEKPDVSTISEQHRAP
jgi:hypothetical protein